MEATVHRKDSIVFTTIDVMNEYGVQAISTREVAKREGVTEGAIFKHFPKKIDLIIAVLDVYAQNDKAIFAQIKKKRLKPKDSILYLVDLYATYYENYPAITSIAPAFDELRYHSELEHLIKDIIEKQTQCVKGYIESGQRCGDIRNDLDINTLSDIIIGTFYGICLKWRIARFEFSLRDDCVKAIKIILETV